MAGNAFESFYRTELRRTAYHEAGHAVLHVLFKIPFTTAEVFSDEHPAPAKLRDYSGIVHCDSIVHCPRWALAWELRTENKHERAQRYWQRQTCILLGGAIAEARYLRRKAKGLAGAVGRHDRRELGLFVKWVMAISSPCAVDEWSFELEPVVSGLLNLPFVWTAVTAVAEELIVRHALTFDETQRLVNSALRARLTKPQLPEGIVYKIQFLAPRLAKYCAVRTPAPVTRSKEPARHRVAAAGAV